MFAQHGVSIQTVRQEGRGDDAQLVIVTHSAPDAALSATVVVAARRMPDVVTVTSVDAGRGRRRSDEEHATAAPVARCDRGVPRLAARHDGTPVVTLREGGTPLVDSRWLSERTGARSGSRSRATIRPARSRTAA